VASEHPGNGGSFSSGCTKVAIFKSASYWLMKSSGS